MIGETLGSYAAHAKGIVHRDLKPDNVFLARDERAPHGFEIKILDSACGALSRLAARPDLTSGARMTPT